MGSFLLSTETPGDAVTVLGGSGSNPTIPGTLVVENSDDLSQKVSGF